MWVSVSASGSYQDSSPSIRTPRPRRRTQRSRLLPSRSFRHRSDHRYPAIRIDLADARAVIVLLAVRVGPLSDVEVVAVEPSHLRLPVTPYYRADAPRSPHGAPF